MASLTSLGRVPARDALEPARQSPPVGGLPAATEALCRWLRSGLAPQPSSPEAASALARAAATHGLAGRLAPHVEHWPGTAAGELRAVARDAAVRTGLQLACARDACAAIESAGLSVLPLKGAALLGRVYSDPAQRPMHDVDLLALEPRSRAEEVLAARGYVLLSRGHHATAFRSPEGLELELHAALATPPGIHPLPFAGIRARRIPGPAAGTADLVAQLAIHGAFQHGLALRLGQWLDFRALLEREPLDPAAALPVFAEYRALGEVYAALRAAELLVAAPVAELLAALEPRVPRALRRHLASRLGRPASLLVASGSELARAQLALASGRRAELVRATLWPAGLPLARVPGRALLLLRRVLVAAR